MEIGMNAIRSRISVRTYADTALTKDEEEALHRAFTEAVPGPFGAIPRFLLATRDEIEDEASHATSVQGGLRIGTYGMIVGPRAFIAGVVAKRPFACVDFGYKKLVPGGYFHAATDWEHYAKDMLKILSAGQHLQNTSPTMSFCPRPDYRPLTKFENRGLGLGHGVWDLIFRKQ